MSHPRATLSTQLEELVEAGYLAREQYAEIPPRAEYDLTPTGEELCRRLEALLEWAEREQSANTVRSNQET
ncbi:winged helix-turn-helix transcriptional regulator [Natrialba swarupiae]|uniref:Helix-turn-helix transcriptional regulator n=1 Tax=Natrialba swarupiae TaxID=2448032 RepID=A0A5D5AIZ1_9EURY|nr:winged helix-turn-helix transcriptional regulator [Natrialba swarupiae]MCW8172812.1 transcriptional regulator [Natrialba swarupiae]TYT61828.1 helix-turn-helix transcriptional regulator [Natrialba swarupiae]